MTHYLLSTTPTIFVAVPSKHSLKGPIKLPPKAAASVLSAGRGRSHVVCELQGGIK